MESLTAAGIRAIARRLCAGEPDAELVDHVLHASAGIAFLAHSLLAAVAAGVPEDAVASAGVVVPDPVAAAVELRLAGLSASGRAFAHAVAVLDPVASWRHAGRLAGLSEAGVGATVRELQTAGLLAEAEATYVAPLLARAVRAGIPERCRAQLHARAARLAYDDGDPPERIAHQLLATHPAGEPWAVDVLRDAADRAMADRRPADAAAYLTRAAGEPPDRPARAAVLLELGIAEARAGRPGAGDHLAQAAALGGGDPVAAHATGRMALVLAGEARLREASSRLEAIRARGDVLDATAQAALAGAARQVARLHAGAPTSPPRACRAGQALDAALTGAVPAATVAELVAEGAHGARHDAVCALILAERYAHAERLLRRARTDADARGSRPAIAVAALWSAHLALRRGDVALAAHEASAALVAGGARWELGRPAALAVLAECHLERGETEQAHDVLDVPELGSDRRDAPLLGPFLLARARLYRAQGRPQDALAELDACRAWQAHWDAANPAVIPWRSEAALVRGALGDADGAAELADEGLREARAFGAPRAVGMALRAAGLVRRGPSAFALLEEAVATLADSGARLEHARALVDLGAARRRARERAAARTPLRTGLDLAHRCGATALVERARVELLASGARPRRELRSGVDALTPSERRIAEMAAQGLGNRAIGEALFVTSKTVEAHLRNAFRKLDVRSRTQLPGALAEPQPG